MSHHSPYPLRSLGSVLGPSEGPGPARPDVTETRPIEADDHQGPIDRWAWNVADRVVPAATAVLCLLMLASWVPHYLTWPWWPDLDTFAASAICWAEGIRPYRDVAGYSFPGPIYLFYVLNAVFGAGKTWPIYAVDAAMVAGLGGLLAIWSRRRFGSWWPGLVGFTSLVALHTNLNFSLVAQRDWQTICLVVVALLCPTTWPGRRGLIASAVATAAALTFRPHVVLFGPALIVSIIEGDRQRGGRPRPLSSLLAWCLAATACVILMYLPLITQGLLDDLIRNLRLATYGSHYSRATPSGMVREVVRQLLEPGWIAVPAAVALLAGPVRGAIRREAIIWLTAAACVLLYKPLHPRSHDYLDLPRWVVWMPLLVLLAALIARLPARSGRLRLAASLAILAVAVPSKPSYCNPKAAVAAIASVFKGRIVEEAELAPPGYVHHGTLYDAALYPWSDYRRALDYLRDKVPQQMSVANLMGYQLAAVGATGHRPVFRNESGLLWKSQVGWDDEVFIDRLRAETDSVVVWTPRAVGPEPGLVSPSLVNAVMHWYEPDRVFGDIEIWRRRPEPGTTERDASTVAQEPTVPEE